MVLQAAHQTLTAALKAAGQSRGARGKVAAVEDATPSSRPQVTFFDDCCCCFSFAMYVSLYLFICFFFISFTFCILAGTGRTGQVATAVAETTPRCQVTFSVTADIFRCYLNVTLVSFIFMQLCFLSFL
jgi:hypothetical protein